MIHSAVPEGWFNPFFGWKLDLDWTGIFDSVNDSLRADGNEWFGIVFGLMFFKGILAQPRRARRRTTTCSACSPRAIPARPA